MTRFSFTALERFAEPVYGGLRALAGIMFAFHGVQKIFAVFTEHPPAVGTQVWFGGLIEIATGLLMAAGLFTPCAALLASGTMAVAYLQFHWKFAFGERFFPAVNKGELALLYSVLFLYIACRGGGYWSLDRLRRRARP